MGDSVPATGHLQAHSKTNTFMVNSRKTSNNSCMSAFAGAKGSISNALPSSKHSANDSGSGMGTANRVGNDAGLDFNVMDQVRMQSDMNYVEQMRAPNVQVRIDDQRRRLESFLLLARQAQAKRDITKIKDLIRQIDETSKPLPMSRINELKMLELMTSPYN